MKIQRTNISHFFHFNLKSALPIFMDENTSVASFPYFFNFNLKWALPIFIDENTKIIFRNKLASFPIFFTITLGRLYLFSSMKIPRTHMKSLHVYMIFIDKQFCACQLKYKEQTFPIFSTLTLSRLYFHR
jgi:hypothetical protein